MSITSNFAVWPPKVSNRTDRRALCVLRTRSRYRAALGVAADFFGRPFALARRTVEFQSGRILRRPNDAGGEAIETVDVKGDLRANRRRQSSADAGSVGRQACHDAVDFGFCCRN